jgi:hypothetical protein
MECYGQLALFGYHLEGKRVVEESNDGAGLLRKQKGLEVSDTTRPNSYSTAGNKQVIQPGRLRIRLLRRCVSS